MTVVWIEMLTIYHVRWWIYIYIIYIISLLGRRHYPLDIAGISSERTMGQKIFFPFLLLVKASWWSAVRILYFSSWHMVTLAQLSSKKKRCKKGASPSWWFGLVVYSLSVHVFISYSFNCCTPQVLPRLKPSVFNLVVVGLQVVKTTQLSKDYDKPPEGSRFDLSNQFKVTFVALSCCQCSILQLE